MWLDTVGTLWRRIARRSNFTEAEHPLAPAADLPTTIIRLLNRPTQTMTASSRMPPTPSKRTKKSATGKGKVRSRSAASPRSASSATNLAIATELAPAVAIALLEKTEQAPGAAAPSLDCLAAGVAPSETEGKVRVQLMFENGAVLPVEMSTAAGIALSKGLVAELPKK